MKKIALGFALATVLFSHGAQADEEKKQRIADIYTQLASGYLDHGAPGVALEEIKVALQNEPNYAPAYGVRALIHSSLREFDDAEKDFKHGLELAPDDFDINHNYGWFLCNRMNKPKESVRFFIAAVKNPLYQSPQKSLQQAAICSIKANDLDAADDYLQRANTVHQDDPATLLIMAQLAYSRGKFESARTLLNHQSQLTPPTAESLWLAICTQRKLHADSTAQLEQNLAKQFPDSDEALKLAKGEFD